MNKSKPHAGGNVKWCLNIKLSQDIAIPLRYISKGNENLYSYKTCPSIHMFFVIGYFFHNSQKVKITLYLSFDDKTECDI